MAWGINFLAGILFKSLSRPEAQSTRNSIIINPLQKPSCRIFTKTAQYTTLYQYVARFSQKSSQMVNFNLHFLLLFEIYIVQWIDIHQLTTFKKFANGFQFVQKMAFAKKRGSGRKNGPWLPICYKFEKTAFSQELWPLSQNGAFAKIFPVFLRTQNRPKTGQSIEILIIGLFSKFSQELWAYLLFNPADFWFFKYLSINLLQGFNLT